MVILPTTPLVAMLGGFNCWKSAELNLQALILRGASLQRLTQQTSLHRRNHQRARSVTERVRGSRQSHIRSCLCFKHVSCRRWIKARQCKAVCNTIMCERSTCRNCEKGFVTGFHKEKKTLIKPWCIIEDFRAFHCVKLYANLIIICENTEHGRQCHHEQLFTLIWWKLRS